MLTKTAANLNCKAVYLLMKWIKLYAKPEAGRLAYDSGSGFARAADGIRNTIWCRFRYPAELTIAPKEWRRSANIAPACRTAMSVWITASGPTTKCDGRIGSRHHDRKLGADVLGRAIASIIFESIEVWSSLNVASQRSIATEDLQVDHRRI